MRSKIILAILFLMLLLVGNTSAKPMGTAWTYQGRLMDANGPADGVFEFEFKLYDSPAGGNQLESTLSLRGVDVIDGYFTVEPDFGSDVFDSNEYWLEIGVRPGDSVDPFTTLSPRQRMAPTPYALQTRGIFVDGVPSIIDYPGTWTAKESNREWYSVAMSADGTKQTAVVNNGQVYFSTDSGNTWIATESDRAWMSVAMSADGTKHTAVVDQGQIYICSVVVSYSYNVGIGTSEPSGSLYPDGTVLEITGNAPSIVLDDQWGGAQDDFEISNGGDKVLLRDATDSLDVLTIGLTGAVEGNIGIGTTSPEYSLDVCGSANLNKGKTGAALRVNGVEAIWYDGTYFSWGYGGSANYFADPVGIGMTSPQGQLDVNGSIYQRGILLHGDYVFEPDYELESIEEHSEFMWKHKHLKSIQKRQVDENGVEIVEVGAHRRGIVEELEKAHIYIEQLNNRIKTLEEKLSKLETELNNAQ
jgi:hypothetical protein